MILILMPLLAVKLQAQHQVVRLDGYLMNLKDEGRVEWLHNGHKDFIRHEPDRRFFVTSLDLPWEELRAYSCFYQLDVKEIRNVSFVNSPPLYAYQGWRGRDNPKLDTTGNIALRNLLQQAHPIDSINESISAIDHLEKSLHARVDIYKCSIWVVYLGEHDYGDCDGNLRKIPWYGLIPNVGNYQAYLCSVVLPIFLKAPKPYRPWDH